MDIDQDEHEHEHEHEHSRDDSEPPTASTRAGKRVAELHQVEENIAALLHFAGCTLASLHPDPLSSFTVREIATDDPKDDDDDEEEEEEQQEGSSTKEKKPAATTPKADQDQDEAKLQEFAKYAEGYFATLNDVQLALRTSIRHLRVSRISARALTDPSYGSLQNRSSRPSDHQNTAAVVGPGGVAFSGGADAAAGGGGGGGGDARSWSAAKEAAWDMRASRLPSSSRGAGGAVLRGGGRPPKMSVAALELERDALQELVAALEARRRTGVTGGPNE